MAALTATATGTVWVTQVLVAEVPGRYPGADLAAIVLIGLLAALVIFLTLFSMGRLVQKSAPDFVLTSRLFNTPLGFISSWLLLISAAFFIGGVAGSISQQFLPDLLQTLSIGYSNDEVRHLGEALSSAQIAAIASSGLFILVFSLNFFPARMIRRILNTGLVLLVISWLVLLGQFLGIHPDAFAARYDSLAGAGTYQSHIDIAYQFGLGGSQSRHAATLLLGLQAGLGLFFGAALPGMLAAEIQKNQKRYVRSGLLGLLLSGLLIFGTVLVLQRAVDWRFLAAESFLYQRGVEGIVISGVIKPWLPYYASIAGLSPAYAVVIGIFWFYLLLVMVKVYLLALSRILKAWADGGVAPRWFGHVYARTNTPLIAFLLVTILAQAGLIDQLQGGQVTRWVNFPLYFGLALFPPLLAFTLLPWRQPDWFSRFTGIFAARFGGLPVISLLGGGAIFFLLLGILLTIIQPVRFYYFSWQTLLILAALCLSGFGFYRWQSRCKPRPKDTTEGLVKAPSTLD